MAARVSEVPGGPVAESERGGPLALLMSWWTTCSAIFYLNLAPALAVTYGSRNAIIGLVLTAVTYSFLAPVFARRAIETGLSAELISERIFGSAGALCTALILGFAALYYAIFEGSVLALAASKVFSELNYVIACVIVVALTVPLVLSERILASFERANFILLPTYVIGLAALVVLAGTHFGWSRTWLDLGPVRPPAFGWWHCYAAYMGVWVLIVITTDFAPLGRKEDAIFHARVTFGLPFYVMTFLVNGLAGIFLVGVAHMATVSEISIVDVSLLVLGGAAGLAFVTATQLRINLANFYVAAFNFSSAIEALVGRRPQYWLVVLAACVAAAFVMATQGAFKYMLISLQYMAIFLCSWVGVALSRGSPAALESEPESYSQRGAILAWVFSTILAVVISLAPGVIGSFAPAISFVIGFTMARAL